MQFTTKTLPRLCLSFATRLDVYPTDDDAVQAMNAVAQLAARCSKVPQTQGTAGILQAARQAAWRVFSHSS